MSHDQTLKKYDCSQYVRQPRPQWARQTMLSVLIGNLKFEVGPTNFANNLLIFIFYKNHILTKSDSDRLYCSFSLMLTNNKVRRVAIKSVGIVKCHSR